MYLSHRVFRLLTAVLFSCITAITPALARSQNGFIDPTSLPACRAVADFLVSE